MRASRGAARATTVAQRLPRRRALWASTTTPEAAAELARAPAPASTAVTPGMRLRVRELLECDDARLEELLGKEVTVKGWVRTIRKQKKFCFVEVNDGSSLKGVQCIIEPTAMAEPDATAAALGEISTGAAVAVRGVVSESPGGEQRSELKATTLEVVGTCADPKYPLQKKRHSLEFLRTIAHLRPRTNTIAAVARVRSTLAQATHEFFREQGFLYLHTPLITASDCEGAGEMFRVTTMPEKISELPRVKPDGDGAAPDEPTIDFNEDFFGAPAFLTVSGQLAAETYACAMGDVYTFGPTFRAENSQTARHLAEFHMIEPEMAFSELDDAMDNAERFVQYVVRATLSRCASDLTFFDKARDATRRAPRARGGGRGKGRRCTRWGCGARGAPRAEAHAHEPTPRARRAVLRQDAARAPQRARRQPVRARLVPRGGRTPAGRDCQGSDAVAIPRRRVRHRPRDRA